MYYDKNEGYVSQAARQADEIPKMENNGEGSEDGIVGIGEKIRTISKY